MFCGVSHGEVSSILDDESRQELNLIIGNGLIGRHLYYALREDAVLTTRKEVDLSKGYWDLPKCRVAYICAGVTSTQECEEHSAESYLVNVTNTVKLAQALSPAQVVWLSSERVFDGMVSFRKVTDRACPVTEYGKQKAEAEKVLLEMGATVIRFSKVIGWDIPLWEGWVGELMVGQPIYPFSNMSVSPLPVRFVVSFIRKIAALRAGGLYQVSALEDISYDSIAYHIASYSGQMNLVHPIECAVSHPNSTLDDNGVAQQIGMDIPWAWQTIHEWCEDRIGNQCLRRAQKES